LKIKGWEKGGENNLKIMLKNMREEGGNIVRP